MADPRYPIGRFQYNGPNRQQWVGQLAKLPSEMRSVVAGLSDPQLDTTYRDGGWTVRQVVHHVADSHMNSYVRFRLALTEDEPTIRAYDEKRWAELADAKGDPVAVSCNLLDALHTRWVRLLSSLGDDGWHRTFVHPEGGRISIDQAAGFYAWHGRHHVAQIAELRRRMGW